MAERFSPHNWTDDVGEFTGGFVRSGLYSAFEAPVVAGAQVVDNLFQTDISKGLAERLPQPAKAEFGSAAWTGQTLGGAAGMLVPLLAVREGIVKPLFGSPAGTRAALGMTLREAALTGFVYDGLFQPSEGKGLEFFTNRFANGLIGGANFAALTAGSLSLNAAAETSLAKSLRVAPALRNPIVNGAISGLPAAFMSSELSAAYNHHRAATGAELTESLAGMALAGATLGGIQAIRSSRTAETTTEQARVATEIPPADRLTGLKLIAEPSEIATRLERHTTISEPDIAALRRWWRTADSYDSLLREQRAVAERLEPEVLTQLVFGQHGRPVSAELAQFAQRNPELVRDLAANTRQLDSGHQHDQLVAVLEMAQRGTSLATISEFAARTAEPIVRFDEEPSHVPDAIEYLTSKASRSEVQSALSTLTSIAREPYSPQYEARQNMAFQIAGRIRQVNPDLADRAFFDPMAKLVSDPTMPYDTRVFTAAKLAQLERSGRLSPSAVPMPDGIRTTLSIEPQRQAQLRQAAEAALKDPRTFDEFISSDEMANYFPETVANASRAEAMLNKVRNNPRFIELNEKDRENLLWATFLREAGRNLPEGSGLDVSAQYATFALRSLGYPTARVQRIANLIAHSDALSAGIEPGEVAPFVRHPSMPKQIRVLTEAESGPSVDLSKAELRLADAAERLNQNSFGVLQTELPQRAGVYTLPHDFGVLAHSSRRMLDGRFFDQLPIMETPHYSMSASYLVPEALHPYTDARIVALVSAPPENVSQAYNTSLFTGEQTGKQGHQLLTRSWSEHSRPLDREVADLISVVGLDLPTYRDRLSQYDSMNELSAAPELREAHDVARDAYTRMPTGDRIEQGAENEFKINNPLVNGIGIIRRGQPIYFEGVSDLRTIFPGGNIPSWVAREPQGALVVPNRIWQESQRRNLPIVVLDP